MGVQQEAQRADGAARERHDGGEVEAVEQQTAL